MSVNKIIKFYYLEPEPCLTANGIYMQDISKATFVIFQSAFPQKDFYSIYSNNKNFFFDIISYDNKKMFATCSIDETIKATSFVQKRDKTTKKTSPFTTSNVNEQLESYTFFYIDFINNRMAVIANKKIPKIHDVLCQFIWEKSGNKSRITIKPEMISNIEEEANKLINPSWLELDFGRSGAIGIPPLKEVLGKEFSAKQYQLRIRIEETKNKKGLIKKLIGLKDSAKTDDLSSLKLVGKNELGLDETLNFFEAVYSKTVPLELTDNTVTNLSYIEQCLKEFLNLHLGIA